MQLPMRPPTLPPQSRALGLMFQQPSWIRLLQASLSGAMAGGPCMCAVDVSLKRWVGVCCLGDLLYTLPHGTILRWEKRKIACRAGIRGREILRRRWVLGASAQNTEKLKLTNRKTIPPHKKTSQQPKSRKPQQPDHRCQLETTCNETSPTEPAPTPPLLWVSMLWKSVTQRSRSQCSKPPTDTTQQADTQTLTN